VINFFTVGDLLDREVDVIVNPWNRNIIPWWLLLPQGVSGAIKRRAGTAPFKELAKHGPMALGDAVHTKSGRLPHRGIIHVAGINMFWRATEQSVRDSTEDACRCAHEHGYKTIAFPLIGAGSGGLGEARSRRVMTDVLDRLDMPLAATLVVFRGGGCGGR
jgi:O-acetyl-ADP-ribose deacetylase (regulator of RNase III)